MEARAAGDEVAAPLRCLALEEPPVGGGGGPVAAEKLLVLRQAGLHPVDGAPDDALVVSDHIGWAGSGETGDDREGAARLLGELTDLGVAPVRAG